MSARDLGYIGSDEAQKYIDELHRVDRMIVGYIRYLKKKNVK